MPSNLQNVAIFGATGNIGARILNSLLYPHIQNYYPKVTVILRSGTKKPSSSFPPSVRVVYVDLSKHDDLVQALNGVDAVVSVLSGPGIDAQLGILEAAVEAGVKRFYPSEFGQHQVYTPPNDDWGLVHPMWNQKARVLDRIIRHPAVESGKISYTVIGNGDFYDQEWESVWCPWAQDRNSVSSYTVLILGDGDAKADWSCIDDIANFVVATLARPDDSRNKTLNFPSDTISLNRIADLLERYSGKEVHRERVPTDEVHRVIKDPALAPKEVTESSQLPVQFWYTVKSIQGMGVGYRPEENNCCRAWPEVMRTSVEKWLQNKFGSQKRHDIAAETD